MNRCVIIRDTYGNLYIGFLQGNEELTEFVTIINPLFVSCKSRESLDLDLAVGDIPNGVGGKTMRIFTNVTLSCISVHRINDITLDIYNTIIEKFTQPAVTSDLSDIFV